MAHITFRTHLIGSVTDFCSESHLPFVTPDILAGLIVRLSHYQEEGVRLQPQVYLTDNINALMSMLPGGERLQLATTTADVEGIDRMLKVCAPIATTEWRIFCHHRSNDTMEFGVFRGSINPIAVDLDEVILAAQDNVSIVKIHHVASNCVHVRHSKGADRYVFFDHRKEDSPQPLQYVDDFITSVTKRVKEKNKDAVQNYLANPDYA